MAVTMYSTTWCGYCSRLKAQMGREGIEYTEVDIERDPEAAAFVESVNGGNQTVPTLLFAGRHRSHEPQHQGRQGSSSPSCERRRAPTAPGSPPRGRRPVSRVSPRTANPAAADGRLAAHGRRRPRDTWKPCRGTVTSPARPLALLGILAVTGGLDALASGQTTTSMRPRARPRRALGAAARAGRWVTQACALAEPGSAESRSCGPQAAMTAPSMTARRARWSPSSRTRCVIGAERAERADTTPVPHQVSLPSRPLGDDVSP